ncbi:MAG: hypothetical protein RMM17_08845 [Acidobacteriota bacterium]|nr:hypothetical protein [Blastocatellia bacterium]MDW8412773.1 hypothetical protein [Acidobacteriota bacterium]
MSEKLEQLDQVFVGLVKKSWQYHNEVIRNTYLDDMLVGAVIASTVEIGYSLIDLNSDGQNHYLRFEHLPTKVRVIFRLKNLAEDLLTAKVLGRHAQVIIGYGIMTPNFSSIWQTLKAEIKSSFLDTSEPGIITCDADITAGYIYAQVTLILNLDDYFKANFQIDQTLLQQHIQATLHSLEKYLRGRLQ